jgi:hypothetical protein
MVVPLCALDCARAPRRRVHGLACASVALKGWDKVRFDHPRGQCCATSGSQPGWVSAPQAHEWRRGPGAARRSSRRRMEACRGEDAESWVPMKQHAAVRGRREARRLCMAMRPCVQAHVHASPHGTRTSLAPLKTPRCTSLPSTSDDPRAWVGSTESGRAAARASSASTGTRRSRHGAADRPTTHKKSAVLD